MSAPAEKRLAIHQLFGRRVDRATVEEFVSSRSFPLIEGSTCTFVYRGEASAINLRHWIFGLPSSMPFQRLPGTDLWVLVAELPERSRVEYKFEVIHRGHAQWVEDPLNPHHARDPFGQNSVVYGEGYERPSWSLHDPEARPGSFEDFTLESAALGGERKVTLYLPARFRRTRRYPLLVVHDGADYLQFSDLKLVLDNLIHRQDVSEMVVAITYPEDRLREYGNDERHARFLTEELVPKLEREWPLRGTPRGRGLMGASFGAVASMSTAVRYPGFFGRMLLQSGSFAFTDIGENQRGPAFESVVAFMNSYRAHPHKFTDRAYVSCGVYESLIYENRSLVPILQDAGIDVRYTEARDGHNWENWRDRMREGLSYLFPGPLWLVYE